MSIGGTPAIIRYLLELGFLDGDCMTGKTLSENAKLFPSLSEGQQVIRPLTNPIKETGHIQILYGNLAPEGSVAKITGKEGLYFSGPAFVFEGEEAMLAAICEDPLSFKKLLLIKKHLIWCVGGEIIVCDIPIEDYNIELENQSGEIVQLGSETDQRSVMMGLMLHANATQLIRMERYKDALEVLPMGEVSIWRTTCQNKKKALCRNENDTQKALDDLTNPESNSAIQSGGGGGSIINRLFLKTASKNTSSIGYSERFRSDFEDSDRYQSAVQSDFEDPDRFRDSERFRSSVATVICIGDVRTFCDGQGACSINHLYG
ncbi:unnamed protein product [Camellia sinensis]